MHAFHFISNYSYCTFRLKGFCTRCCMTIVVPCTTSIDLKPFPMHFWKKLHQFEDQKRPKKIEILQVAKGVINFFATKISDFYFLLSMEHFKFGTCLATKNCYKPLIKYYCHQRERSLSLCLSPINTWYNPNVLKFLFYMFLIGY